MKLAVIGTGYVGSVTGICFAETGNQVTCVDIDPQKVADFQQGKIPIYEPGLDVLLHRNLSQKRLSFTTDFENAVLQADIIFLALPTPPDEDGSADLSYVLATAQKIGFLLNNYKIIVNKSTVPVGTAERVHQVIAQNTNTPFDVVSNPEFLREGSAVEDFLKPDRIIIGTRSAQAEKIMRELYAPFLRQGNPIYCMDERSAEITKYAANAYLATRISFMNEIANICERTGANVDQVRLGMGSDMRIGKRFLFAGVGYGGSCFPKDVAALSQTASGYQYPFQILHAVMQVNQQQRSRFVEKIKQYYNHQIKGLKFAIWGLAFKPNTDDVREAPAIDIIQALLAEGATITAFDPEAIPNMKKVFGDRIEFVNQAYEALTDADALLILTEWNVFRTPSFDTMLKLMRQKVIFDGRNLYDPEAMQQKGFYYESIGRQPVGISHFHPSV